MKASLDGLGISYLSRPVFFFCLEWNHIFFQAPRRMQMTPVRSLTVEPGCLLPENFTGVATSWFLIIIQSVAGEWVNTANIDADVKINSTHIIEKWNPDVGRWRKVIYICVEQRDSRYMMARLTVDGWWVETLSDNQVNPFSSVRLTTSVSTLFLGITTSLGRKRANKKY